MDRLKGLLGLGAEAETGAVCERVLEAFRDLGATLNLPAEATVSQMRGAVEALKAGEEQSRKMREDLEGLRSRLAHLSASQVVGEALKAGKISPGQREWAYEYFRRDPEGFNMYVARAPKILPAGESLRLIGEAPPGEKAMAPEELALCRSLNLSAEEYLRARAAKV